MLESLPEIDDRFFALPRMNSLKAAAVQVQYHQQLQPHEEEKPNLLQTLSWSQFDWAALASLSSEPELDQVQLQPQMVGCANGDACAPSVPARLDNTMVDEEVKSGIRIHQQTQGLTNLIDPFGYHYPAQSTGFGCGQ